MQLIRHFGWQSVFIAGGILPLILVPFALLALPESIKFLLLSPANGATIAKVLRRIDPRGHFANDSAFVLGEVRPGRGQIAALFSDGLAAGSILLCLAFFMSLMLVYLFINWIPLLLRQAGLPLEQALLGTIIFNLAGIIGSVICTQLMDRKVAPPVTILIVVYFIGALAVLSIGFVGTSFWPIMTAIFFSGFFVIGVQLSLNAYITNFYPTAIRGTGVGWSQVVGQFGSLCGPLVGGVLVAQGMAPNRLFQVSSVAPLLACLLLIVFARFSRRKPSAVTGL